VVPQYKYLDYLDDMKKEEFDNIIESQKNLKDLPNNVLINQMDLLTEEHEIIKDIIVKNTFYLDKLEELYNNLLKVYQERTNER
jgi:hypothetical protein